ncbi:MAG: ISAs1 family transposase [Treponema sp.]|nr:ISAs1 family transposase [Treponema sp.]
MDIRANLAIIPDPRIARCKKHLLTDILLLCIIAMVCGVESVEDIAFFGITHIQWLKKYLTLPHGIPSADTILRVLGRIDHTKFEESFLNWTRGYFQERVQPGSVIAIDGKTVRGSATDTQRGVHLVSAWSDELGLVLGQVKTKEKSNEITAIPQLLSVLDMSGCIITIDAMGCQKQIAADIIRGKGDYVLSLKENHPEAHAEVKELFDEKSLGEPEYTEITKDHGRIEKREAWLNKDVSWFEGKEGWPGLKGFGCIRSSRPVKEATAVECRYFLTSLADTAQFARSVRSHWGIENKLHWTLDAVFREDYARNRKDRSAANLAVLRKITLNLIRLEKTEKYQKQKFSLNRKRLYASYNPDFLLNILCNL